MGAVVQFGAGNIGRGFMGQLFCEAGHEVVFVDVDEVLVAELNRRRSYSLRLVGPDRFDTLEVGPVRAIHAGDSPAISRELSTAGFACTAVGVNVLPRLAPTLAAGLIRRSEENPEPLNVLLCENRLRCSDELRGNIQIELPTEHRELSSRLGLVETVVARMVPVVPASERALDPLLVMAEDYSRLPAERGAFVGPLPQIPGLEPVEDLRPWAERKLFIHNMGHAAAAYLGYSRQHRTIDAAMSDPVVSDLVEAAMGEVGAALCLEHGFAAEEMAAYSADLLRRFKNPALGDTVARVGRDPLRKLGHDDRLIGALRLCSRHRIGCPSLLRAIAAALAYDAPEDPGAVDLKRRLQDDGAARVLHDVCGLAPETELPGQVLEARQQAQAA